VTVFRSASGADVTAVNVIRSAYVTSSAESRILPTNWPNPVIAVTWRYPTPPPDEFARTNDPPVPAPAVVSTGTENVVVLTTVTVRCPLIVAPAECTLEITTMSPVVSPCGTGVVTTAAPAAVCDVIGMTRCVESAA